MTNTTPQPEEQTNNNAITEFNSAEITKIQLAWFEKKISDYKEDKELSEVLQNIKSELVDGLSNTPPNKTTPNTYLETNDQDVTVAKNKTALKGIDCYLSDKVSEFSNDPENQALYAELRAVLMKEDKLYTLPNTSSPESTANANQSPSEQISEVTHSESHDESMKVADASSQPTNLEPKFVKAEKKFNKKPSVILNKANNFGSTIAAVTPYLATACVAVPMVIGSAAVALSNVPFFATVGVSAYMLKTLNNKYKQSPPGSAEYENKSKFSKFMLNGAHTLTTALGLGVGGAAVAACSLTALAYAPALIASVTGLFAANSILATGAVNALTVGAGIYGVKKVINHISEDGKGHGNQSQILQKLAAIRDKALGSEDALSPKLPKLG